MTELTAGVNWLAVGVGTVVAFMLGWLWYSPKLFGKTWAAGVGVDLGAASGMPVAAMLMQLLSTFLLAWIVGVTAARNALATIVLILVAVAAFIAANGFFGKKSQAAIAIEASFVIAMGVVMIIVQGIL